MLCEKIQNFGYITGPLVSKRGRLHNIEPSYDRP